MVPVLAARSDTAPDLEAPALRLIPTPVACQLTGLSTEKLREWTSRRALIPADVRPKQKGSPAQFTWQTILVLRLAVLLRDRFSIELQAHKSGFDGLRAQLASTSFIALWGQRLALRPQGDWQLIDAAPIRDDALIVHLDPHLAVIRDGFALPDRDAAGQLDLFSLPKLHAPASPTDTPVRDVSLTRRRSA